MTLQEIRDKLLIIYAVLSESNFKSEQDDRAVEQIHDLITPLDNLIEEERLNDILEEERREFEEEEING